MLGLCSLAGAEPASDQDASQHPHRGCGLCAPRQVRSTCLCLLVPLPMLRHPGPSGRILPTLSFWPSVPCSVDAVAKAAVSAVLDPSVPPGIMDVWQIGKYE